MAKPYLMGHKTPPRGEPAKLQKLNAEAAKLPSLREIAGLIIFFGEYSGSKQVGFIIPYLRICLFVWMFKVMNLIRCEDGLFGVEFSYLPTGYVRVRFKQKLPTWRIIPLSKWLITMVSKSPK